MRADFTALKHDVLTFRFRPAPAASRFGNEDGLEDPNNILLAFYFILTMQEAMSVGNMAISREQHTAV